MQQCFLSIEQWWHSATTGVHGISCSHENIVAFVTRQLLDMWSPSNFLLSNPDVLARTVVTDVGSGECPTTS